MFFHLIDHLVPLPFPEGDLSVAPRVVVAALDTDNLLDERVRHPMLTHWNAVSLAVFGRCSKSLFGSHSK